MVFTRQATRTLAKQLPELLSILPRAVTNDEAILILQRIADGDAKVALTEFYDAYAGGVFAMLIRMLGERHEAEELLQEVFVEIWRRAPSYDFKKASVKTWIAQIARSRGIDLIRARNSRGAGKHVDVGDIVLKADSSSDPEAATGAKQRQTQIQSALQTLTEEQREALTLSYYGGLSHNEIAKKLDLPLGTIKSRILSAMKILRAEFGSGGVK